MIVTLPYPPSVNHYWLTRGKTRFLSPRAKRYRQEVLLAVQPVKDRNPGLYPLSTRLFIFAQVHCPDRRVRDLDNILKGLLDSLTHAGIYHDDNQIDKLLVVRESVFRPNGKIELIIEEM